MQWTKPEIIRKMHDIHEKGFIAIPPGSYRKDDGIVGQILEREFGVSENNLHVADLGTYELKGMRLKKGRATKLTLFHQTSTHGLTPVQIFDRFSYEKASRRDGRPKQKLFTTIRGDRKNNLGFILRAGDSHEICLFHDDEYLASWDVPWRNGRTILTNEGGQHNADYHRHRITGHHRPRFLLHAS